MLLILFTGCTKTTSTTTATSKSNDNVVAVQESKKSSNNQYGKYDEEDYDEGYDKKTATKIELKDSGSIIDGSGVSEKDNTISITAGGTYILSGNYKGQLKVSANEETVHLVMNNVSISNESSSAIYVEQAKKLLLL